MRIVNVLKAQFGIDRADVVKTEGGLSAAAYKVETGQENFFLKVYDKKRTQTPLWIQNIDQYIPILVWLNENTPLRGRIPRPIPTNKSGYRFEDDGHVYLLFSFIEGETVAKKPLTLAQAAELAEIMAHLHSNGEEIPFETGAIKEDFEVPFCTALEGLIAGGYATLPADVKGVLGTCLEQLVSQINETKSLSHSLKKKNIHRVLCHTDAHGWNLMQGSHLFLVD